MLRLPSGHHLLVMVHLLRNPYKNQVSFQPIFANFLQYFSWSKSSKSPYSKGDRHTGQTFFKSAKHSTQNRPGHCGVGHLMNLFLSFSLYTSPHSRQVSCRSLPRQILKIVHLKISHFQDNHPVYYSSLIVTSS